MRTNCILIGNGGHAKVVLSILRLSPALNLVGLVGPEETGTIGNLPLLGGDTDLEQIASGQPLSFFVGVGHNRRRLELFHEAKALGMTPVNAIHPSATVDPSVKLGEGVAIMAGAVVNCDTTIGDAAIINTSATVDHDCVLGDAVHVGPGSHLSGYVRVSACALVGIGSTVGRGAKLQVGANVVIGAGSVVINDVPDGTTVTGNPAQPVWAAIRT